MNKDTIRKSEILNKLTYNNFEIQISEEDKEYISYLENYAISKQYVFFHKLSPKERKELELEYVKKYFKYKEKGDKEKMNEYLERIIFGNLYFIIQKAKRGYLRRIDKSITLSDIISVAISGVIKALNSYKIDNEWNARFLRYAEKFIEGNIYSLLYYKGPGNVLSIEEIVETVNRKNSNRDNFSDLNENDINLYNEDSLNIEFEEDYLDSENECDCLYTILEYITNDTVVFPNKNYVDCLLLSLIDKNIIDCILSKNKTLILK